MNTTNEQYQAQAGEPQVGPAQADLGHHRKHVVGLRWNGSDTLGGDPRRKRVALAVMLSALPGTGQVYVGYYQQGITLMVIAGSLLTVLTRSWYFSLYAFEPLLVMSTMFTWLYGAVDAGRRASLYNQALAGLRPMDLPEDHKTPEWQGSIVGGVALVFCGLLLFAHTMFGLPMEWVTKWWPLALVLVGVWLVYASIRARTPEPSADISEPLSGNPGDDEV